MITTYIFVAVLLVPGMTEPHVQREPMASIEACQARVQEALTVAKQHEGQEYRFLVGCQLTGNKADPA